MLPENAASFRAWLIDLDGTLYRPGLVKLGMAAELMLFGWGQVGTLRRFRHEHELLRSEHERAETPAVAGQSPFREQLERTARGLGCEVAEVERSVREWMIERPAKWLARARRQELLAEVARFKENGGRTALVSDYPAERKLSALGASSLFEVVVANGEPGGALRLKPDPDGYRRAAQALGVAPEHCLVIGDRDDADGAAARAAGMTFAQI